MRPAHKNRIQIGDAPRFSGFMGRGEKCGTAPFRGRGSRGDEARFRRWSDTKARRARGGIRPIWTAKPETARRVRQRMKTVFDWAKASGYRSGDNPVEGVAKVLPKRNGKKAHHPALPYAQVPEFIAALRKSSAGVSAKLAFEFLILNASRTSEVLLMEWGEVDVDSRPWTVPAARMKSGVTHQVPLSPRCLEILAAAKEISDGSPFVFPGRPGKPLSNMVFEMTLRERMDRTDIVPHGFRSTFRDWAEEKTKFKRSVIEAALAHTIKDKVEAAYLRTRLFDQRRPLMAAWAAFATSKPAQKVVSIRA